jgi:GNAT superfamily N-acetyltransferase
MTSIVIQYDPRYRSDFARLNYAWIVKLFAIEAPDRAILDDPEGSILKPGGQIFFVLRDDRVLGTVALKFKTQGVYELAKMAVDDEARGLGYGKLLMEAAISYARGHGARKIVLSSHSSLVPALSMYRQAGFLGRDEVCDSDYSRCDTYLELDLLQPVTGRDG